LLRVFDANGDGSLTEDEIANATAKLKGLDESKDGKLTEDELRGALPFAPGKPPFGRGGAGRGRGGRPGGEAEIENAPLPKDDQEKRVLKALEQMREGPRFANVSPTDGRLLRLLTEAVDAKCVVEIGTSTGDSGVWMALALRKTDGKLFTHEIDPGRIACRAQHAFPQP
jgi:hypothetical protein